MAKAESGWSQAHHLLAEVAAKVSKHNPHGIDIHFVHQPAFYAGLHTDRELDEVFNTVAPRAATYNIIKEKLRDIIDGYISTLCPIYYR